MYLILVYSPRTHSQCFSKITQNCVILNNCKINKCGFFKKKPHWDNIGSIFTSVQVQKGVILSFFICNVFFGIHCKDFLDIFHNIKAINCLLVCLGKPPLGLHGALMDAIPLLLNLPFSIRLFLENCHLPFEVSWKHQ